MEEIQVESLIQSIRLWKRHRSSFFLYIKILVSEQGNTICEKTVEFSQIVDYEERQKGLS